LDNYKDLNEIIETFKIAAGNSKKVFVNIDNSNIQKLKGDYITYAIEHDAHYKAKNIKFDELNSSFDIYKDGKYLTHINLIIPGIHNVYNALAIVSVLDYLGFKGYEKYFSEFRGMGRRFQLVADVNNIKIIDDYAHHPSEIQSTLSSIKNLTRRKVVVFQPHRYTRLKALWSEFLNSFNEIDELYVLDTFCAGDNFDEKYNSKNFTDAIIQKGINASYVKGTMQEAAEDIAKKLKKGDMVLTLGAGDVTKIGGIINDLLSK